MIADPKRAILFVVALTVVALAIGLGGGVMAGQLLAERKHAKAELPPSARTGFSPRGMEKLVAALELTEDESERVRAVFEGRRERFESVITRFREEMHTLRTETHDEVRSALPDGKQEAFDTLLAEREERHEGFGRGRRGGEYRMDPARHDTNGDGRIEREEWQGPPHVFDRMDADEDGVLSAEEAEQRRGRRGRRGRHEPEAPTGTAVPGVVEEGEAAQ